MRAVILLVLSCLIGCCSCGRAKYKSGWPEENAVSYAIDDFGVQEAKRYGLKMLFVGNVTDSWDVHYCVTFLCDRAMRLEEGKKLARPILDDFYQMLTKEPKVRRYALRYLAYKGDDERPRLTDTVALKIAFWDKDVNRPKPPHLAQILFVNNTFYYYDADPHTQELRLMHQEPYSA